MLVLLSCLALAADDELYSLIPPYIPTDLGEIGNWSLRGSALNLKRYLRLTSATPSEYGAVCHRVPTTFVNWTMELQLRTSAAPQGKGFWFFFTKEFCPGMVSDYQGISMWINTTERNSKGEYPFYFLSNPTGERVEIRNIKPVSSIPLPTGASEAAPVSIKIVKKGYNLEFYYKTDSEYKPLYTDYIENFIEFGYISVSSFTTVKAYDFHDLISLRTLPQSPSSWQINVTQYSASNKKELQQSIDFRRYLKTERRNRMQTVMEYMDDEKEKFYLEDALHMIDEIEDRMAHGVLFDDLYEFIDSKLSGPIQTAIQKFHLTEDLLAELRDELGTIYADIGGRILGIEAETKKYMEDLKKTSVDLVKGSSFSNSYIAESEPKLADAASSTQQSRITSILAIISFAETIAYLVFFCVRHRKTQGFKKVD